MRPRFYQARNSRCVYVPRLHLYWFVNNPHGRPADGWRQTGITTKLLRDDGQWRHFTVSIAYKRSDALLMHWEVVWHLSTKLNGGRILRSKRYLRFKVCL